MRGVKSSQGGEAPPKRDRSFSAANHQGAGVGAPWLRQSALGRELARGRITGQCVEERPSIEEVAVERLQAGAGVLAREDQDGNSFGMRRHGLTEPLEPALSHAPGPTIVEHCDSSPPRRRRWVAEIGSECWNDEYGLR